MEDQSEQETMSNNTTNGDIANNCTNDAKTSGRVTKNKAKMVLFFLLRGASLISAGVATLILGYILGFSIGVLLIPLARTLRPLFDDFGGVFSSGRRFGLTVLLCFVSAAVSVAIEKKCLAKAPTGEEANVGHDKSKVRSNTEVSKHLPRYFLILTGIVLLIAGGCMVTAISWQFIEQPPPQALDSELLLCWVLPCVIACFVSAMLALLLVVARKPGKKFRAQLALFVLVNLVGSLLAGWMIKTRSAHKTGDYTYINVTIANDTVRAKTRLVTDELITWAILQGGAVDTSMAFFAANALLGVSVNFEFKRQFLQKKTSYLLGGIGLVFILTALISDMLMIRMSFSGGFPVYYRRVFWWERSTFVGSLYMAGLLATASFHSSGNGKKFSIFLLIPLLFMAGFKCHESIEYFNLKESYDREDRLAEAKCNAASNQTHEDRYCVYDTTYQEFKEFSLSRMGKAGIGENLQPPGLACVSLDKVCDGKADLVSPEVDNQDGLEDRHKRRYAWCEDDPTFWRYQFLQPGAAYDEAGCSTIKPLFYASTAILGIDAVLAAVIAIVTLSSLPKVYLAALDKIYTGGKSLWVAAAWSAKKLVNLSNEHSNNH